MENIGRQRKREKRKKKYPKKSQLSKDRWRIFKISKDLKDIVEEN